METKIYYLRSDRTITDDASDQERVDGTTKTICIESETESEMYEEAMNEFKSNSYNHSVTAKFRKDSKVYPASELYVGRKCKISTEKAGIKESIITAIVQSDDNGMIEVTFGNLPVTLSRKIRKDVK